MTPAPRTSIIIAVKGDNPYLRECLQHCQRLTDQNFEILVVTDEPCELAFPKTRVIASGPAGPSVKRDLGAREARGKYLAFLDDDTYPDPGWLKAAVEVLRDEDVAAVGGPAVTPPGEGDREKASGLVYGSWLVGGPYVYRYLPRKARDVDDYPTCNLIIKKDSLMKAGGFNTCYWPGEDTVICLKLTHELNMKIRYDPRILVYHHRRRLFFQHLKQVMNYALHRGYFVKKFPKTSMRISYFIPSIFTLGILFGWIPGLIWPIWETLYDTGILIYLGLVFLTGIAVQPARLGSMVMCGVILTHLTYGVFFLFGLGVKKLKEDA